MQAHKLKEILSATDIEQRVKLLGKQIDARYGDEPLVLVGVLKGAAIFCADLFRAISRSDVEMDFVCLSSYGNELSSSHNIVCSKDVNTNLKGKHVLVVEDIVDTGHSMQFLLDKFSKLDTLSVGSAVLLDKYERREIKITSDFVGFSIASGFVVGYGLDYAENYRNLSGLYEVIFE